MSMLVTPAGKYSLNPPGATPTPRSATTCVYYSYTPADWPNLSGVLQGAQASWISSVGRMYGFPPTAPASPVGGANWLVPR